MKRGKKLMVLWTRINGVERLQVSPEMESRDGQSGLDGRNGRGMDANQGFTGVGDKRVGVR